MRLPLRLFLSYAAVAVIGAAVAYLTVRLLAPALFDHQVGMMNGAVNGMGGQGMGMGAATQAGVHEAFQSALNTALIVGVLASVAAAVVVAWLVTGRLLRPLDAVRNATTQIAAGGTRSAFLSRRNPNWPRWPPTSTSWRAPWRTPRPAAPGCSARSRKNCAPR